MKDPPLPLFIDDDSYGNNIQSHRRPFARAMRRVHDVIARYFSTAFPQDTNVKSVVTRLDEVTKNDKSQVSSLELYELSNLASHLMREQQNIMTREQCEMVMNIFNVSTPLTSEQVDQLRPILRVVMHVALNGVCRVIQYSWQLEKLILPQSLRDRNRAVYLRDCIDITSN
jgi:hypothetical protein